MVIKSQENKRTIVDFKADYYILFSIIFTNIAINTKPIAWYIGHTRIVQTDASLIKYVGLS